MNDILATDKIMFILDVVRPQMSNIIILLENIAFPEPLKVRKNKFGAILAWRPCS
jgi:hypothetical protein